MGASTMEAAQKNGILEVCRRHGVPFADMKKEPGVTCRAEGLELHVCRKALEMDYLINLPVVKGHGQTKVTCALKNYKGTDPGRRKTAVPCPGTSPAHRLSEYRASAGFYSGGQHLRRSGF